MGYLLRRISQSSRRDSVFQSAICLSIPLYERYSLVHPTTPTPKGPVIRLCLFQYWLRLYPVTALNLAYLRCDTTTDPSLKSRTSTASPLGRLPKVQPHHLASDESLGTADSYFEVAPCLANEVQTRPLEPRSLRLLDIYDYLAIARVSRPSSTRELSLAATDQTVK
jgi:hypothetical protein